MHTTQTQIPTCHHLHPTGKRCGSPALRGEQHCYFHHPTRKPLGPAALHTRQSRRAFDFRAPEDRHELQYALSEVIQRLAANQIDTRRAGLLLFALQTSATHLSS